MKQALALALIACTALCAQASQTTPAAKPKSKTTSKAAPVKKLPPKPVEIVLPDADAEQLEAAKLAYLGNYECEFKQTIQIEPNPKKEGYVDVHHLKQTYTMKPVRSSTGALRLEDVTGHTLMIQIANKSMLLDVKVGQRIVDDCISPAQRELMAQMAAEKAARAASGVAEEDNGLGIGK